MLAKINAIPVKPSSASSQATPDLNRLLPQGQNIPATVQQSAPDKSNAQAFRVQVLINSVLLELSVQQPLQKGQQIALSRNQDGNISISLPATPTPPNSGKSGSVEPPATQGNNTAARQTPATQLSATTTAQQTQLIQQLPLNQPQRAVVISSQPAPAATPPATAQAAPSPSSGTQQPQLQAQSTTGTQSTPVTTPAPTASSQPAVAAANATPVQSQPSINQTQSSTSTAASQSTQTTTPPSQSSIAATASSIRPTSEPGGQAPRQASTSPATPPSTSTLSGTNTTTPKPAPAATTQVQPQPSQPDSPAIQRPIVSQARPAPPPAAPENFAVQLKVGQGTVELSSNKPLQPGQHLLVTRTNEQITVQPVPQNNQAKPVQEANLPVVSQILKDALPKQIPVGEGLNQLVQLAQQPAVSSTAQSENINQVVRSLLQLFGVKPGAAGAEQTVKQNIQNSGFFAETRMAAGESVKLDLKQQLGQLVKHAENLPPAARQQMNQLVDSLMARATSQQLTSAQSWRELSDGGMERNFAMDLPILQNDKIGNAELNITEYAPGAHDSEQSSIWKIKLHFDLEALGSLDAEVTIRHDFELSARFWAEKDDTVRLVRERFKGFNGHLSDTGFEVKELNIRQGEPSKPESTVRKSLIDLRT